MKKICLLIFIFIASFSFILTAKADYRASAINPTGSTCDLYKGSTGLCYYNSSLNDYIRNVGWMDTGDQLTVLENYPTIPSPDTNKCKDYYVYSSFYFPTSPNTLYYGYYCHANLVSTALTEELKTEFKNAGFPETYYEKLAILKTAHPTWTFKAINTGLDFNTVVNNESVNGKSLIQVTNYVNDWGYLNTTGGAYNYYNDKYYPYDGSNWYAANKETVEYYLDPRNFLSDMYIFQFEALAYDNSLSDEILLNAIKSAFKNDYLLNFSDIFLKAGKESLVSPLYLASLARQEVGGTDYANIAISGAAFTYGINNYSGLYNFYNIGATSGSDAVFRGLYWANGGDYLENSYLRPWKTPEAAIIGGGIFMGESYIKIGQNTIYFKKWDVVSKVNSKSGDDYIHQYQTNIQAPKSEANIVFNSYSNSGILESPFIFYIPVYSNMPESTTLPPKGNQNNYLSRLTINDVDVVEFNGGNLEYNYYQDINKPTIKINSTSVSNKAKIIGNGTFNIDKNQTFAIHVISENGIERIYKINVILTGTKILPAVDIKTTLNNSGIKNNDKYLSGITIGQNIKYIEEKIKTINKDAKVEYIKNTNTNREDIIATGDKVKITLGSEIKEYQIVIYGDTNGDGKITASDYAKAKNNVLGKLVLENEYSVAADANKDGKITAADYAVIKNTVLGKRTIEQ